MEKYIEFFETIAVFGHKRMKRKMLVVEWGVFCSFYSLRGKVKMSCSSRGFIVIYPPKFARQTFDNEQIEIHCLGFFTVSYVVLNQNKPRFGYLFHFVNMFVLFNPLN